MFFLTLHAKINIGDESVFHDISHPWNKYHMKSSLLELKSCFTLWHFSSCSTHISPQQMHPVNTKQQTFTTNNSPGDNGFIKYNKINIISGKEKKFK